jgi:hypothetical protein
MAELTIPLPSTTISGWPTCGIARSRQLEGEPLELWYDDLDYPIRVLEWRMGDPLTIDSRNALATFRERWPSRLSGLRPDNYGGGHVTVSPAQHGDRGRHHT